ncbi:MAG: DUF4124 domain-containing protein [Candidatus Thiodiazotropha sp.]|jgi:hypothetical protein
MPLRINLIALLLCVISFSCPAAKLYKWVDDEGRTHYSDKLPPTDTHRARSQLDEHGITIDKVDAAKTAEERRQEEEQERLRQERQRIVERQRTQDRVLLRTFRSEDDILMARNGRIEAIETKIRVIQANIKRLKITLEEMQQDAAKRELSGRPVSETLKNDIRSKRNALKNAYRSIINRESDKNKIRQQFAKNQRRFRELKKLNNANSPIIEAQTSFDDALLNVFDCQEDKVCNKPWQLAKQYLKTHSTTPISLSGDDIIISQEPTELTDISISLSRFIDPRRNRTVIFMDLQCLSESHKRNTCQKKPEIKSLKQKFQAALTQE